MGKIAIVGVKGSGKTVLMTALGEKYQVADPFGLVLSPESPDAFGFVRVNMAKMRGGEWPMETPHDSVRAMRWSLQRERADGPNEVFCDLDFLDFGGEIYTEAFGSGPTANSGMWESECAALKAHIGESQMLVVLVNLRDVVSGAADPDTLTALWVTKGMLDYASRDLKLANLAIAFTQVDAYRDVIAASGGLKAVLRKCMPHVYSSYRDLPLFALSAVDRTVEGKDGLPRPAPGFGSQGLDDLVHWILGCTEKGRAYADEIGKAKARPHDLWREIVAGMEALRTDAAQPAGLTAAERCAKVSGLQTAAAELAVSALRHDIPDFTDEGLVERRTELGSWAKLAGLAGEYVRAVAAKDDGLASRLEAGLVAEAAAWPHLLARAREEAQRISAARKGRFKARALGVAALLVSAILGICVAAYHNADVDRLVSEKGYSCESSFGIRNAVWKAGLVHPENRDLVSDAVPETWRCTKAGCRWKRGTLEIEWCGGLVHPDNQWLVSTDVPGTWKCTKPFYRWKRGTSEIEWDAGCAHPICGDLVADVEPEKWRSTKAEYAWDGQNGVVFVGPPAGTKKEIKLPGGEKMTLVWCPPCPQGFLMGSPESEEGHEKDEKQHLVKLTDGFWIGQYEVTLRQWKSVMGCLGNAYAGRDDFPVAAVTWDDCQDFVKKLREVGYSASLPTEAQWEYACRAGTDTPFNFGSVLNGDKANCRGDVPYGTLAKRASAGRMRSVGSYPWPNAWNIYDMHGNVEEWCEDCYEYDSNFFESEAAKVNPCYVSGSSRRVQRGGCWASCAVWCRSAYRSSELSYKSHYFNGFRIVCVSEPRD